MDAPGPSLWMALESVMSRALGVSVGSWDASQAPRVTPGEGGFHPYSVPTAVEGFLFLFLHFFFIYFLFFFFLFYHR